MFATGFDDFSIIIKIFVGRFLFILNAELSFSCRYYGNIWRHFHSILFIRNCFATVFKCDDHPISSLFDFLLIFDKIHKLSQMVLTSIAMRTDRTLNLLFWYQLINTKAPLRLIYLAVIRDSIKMKLCFFFLLIFFIIFFCLFQFVWIRIKFVYVCVYTFHARQLH